MKKIKERFKAILPELIIAVWFLGTMIYALFWAWDKVH